VAEPHSSEPFPSPRVVGQPRDLVWLLAFGLVALFLIHACALTLMLIPLRTAHPELAFSQLFRLAARQAEHNAFFAVPVQTALYVLVALFIYARVVRGYRLRFWPALAWHRVSFDRIVSFLIGGIALALLIQFATLLFPPPEPLPIEKLFSSRAAALLVLGASLLIAPFFEELIFRGYIYTVLERAWGMATAVVASGILFGLLHAPQLFPGWLQIALLCLVGIAFSLARAATGSTFASFLMHLGYNASLAALFLSGAEFRQLALLLC